MDIPSQIALNGAQYAVLGLLGRGKGGCTWLAERAGALPGGGGFCGSAPAREISAEISSEISIATGKLAYPYILRMAERMTEVWTGLRIRVYPIVNDFFGELITVSGLLTGQDLLAQLRGKPLGACLLLPENVLRSGEDVFLDDMRLQDLEKALQVPINIVKSSGNDFVEAVLSAGGLARMEDSRREDSRAEG